MLFKFVMRCFIRLFAGAVLSSGQGPAKGADKHNPSIRAHTYATLLSGQRKDALVRSERHAASQQATLEEAGEVAVGANEISSPEESHTDVLETNTSHAATTLVRGAREHLEPGKSCAKRFSTTLINTCIFHRCARSLLRWAFSWSRKAVCTKYSFCVW